MVTLGQRLKAEREQRGLTVEKLAAETRIPARYFVAIEEDRTADLPSGFFYRSFLRQYARILGLPESDYMPAIQRSLDSDAEQLDARETALPHHGIDVPPMPTGRFNAREEVKRWLIRLALLVVVGAGASGLYYFYQRWKSPAAEYPPPSAQSEPAQQKPAAAVQPAPQTQPSSTPAQPTETAIPQQSPPVESPAADAIPPVNTAGQPQSALNLTLVATTDSWIQLTADGKTVFMDVLKAGQARVFRGNAFMRMRTGNAGGISMEFNGAAVPPAGPIGQVRTVEFTVQGAKVVTPPVVKPEVTPLAVPRPEQPGP
jgi:cytoskeleton protein RodZ